MPSLVQHIANFDTGVGTVESGTLSNNVTQGNLLVLAITTFTGTVTGLGDTQGNTYTPVGTVANGLDNAYLYYVGSAIGGSVVVSGTFSSVHVKSMGLYEYSGISPVSPLVTTNQGSANASTNCSPGAVVPTTANALVVSVGGDFAAGGTLSVTPATNFVIEDSQYDNVTHERYYYQDFTAQPASSVTPNFTLQNAGNSRAIAAVFQSTVASLGYKTLLGAGQ